MPLSLQVQAGYIVENTQRSIIIKGTMLIVGSGSYPAGGLAFDSVILALPESHTNSGINWAQVQSALGYIWQRIPSTKKLMGLQVPPAGSLTTAAPLQQLPSSVDQVTLNNESLSFRVEIMRNA